MAGDVNIEFGGILVADHVFDWSHVSLQQRRH